MVYCCLHAIRLEPYMRVLISPMVLIPSSRAKFLRCSRNALMRLAATAEEGGEGPVLASGWALASRWVGKWLGLRRGRRGGLGLRRAHELVQQAHARVQSSRHGQAHGDFPSRERTDDSICGSGVREPHDIQGRSRKQKENPYARKHVEGRRAGGTGGVDAGGPGAGAGAARGLE